MSARTHQTAPTQFVEADGVRYACRRLGPEGTVPLVRLRHFTGNLDNWDPAFVDALATEREVVLVDCPGVSASSGTPATTVAAMAQQMIAFAVALGPDRVDLLGFSSGGFVAQDIDPRASFAGHDLMTPWTTAAARLLLRQRHVDLPGGTPVADLPGRTHRGDRPVDRGRREVPPPARRLPRHHRDPERRTDPLRRRLGADPPTRLQRRHRRRHPGGPPRLRPPGGVGPGRPHHSDDLQP
ncbi:alpha/beta fold hydrolase [Streptomyces sp. NPDC059690]|uniref:alpha/beta fold hydrolase n=1 Tax=Streptomyces sp. NPDC059690 TaxID=3346907 RepID=UPI0036BEA5A0